MKSIVLLCMVLFTVPALSWDDAQEIRFRHLNEELRCLVCQNQSIAESQAPLATDLRKQVREMIEQGKTDDQIRDYMTERYGDFVLYRPPFKPLTWALWLGPLVMLLLGALLVWRLRKAPQARQATIDQREQLAQKLKALDDD